MRLSTLSRFLIPLLFIFGIFLETEAELITLSMGALAAGSIGTMMTAHHFLKCKWTECCAEPWIRPGISHHLRQKMESKLYGQHIAVDVVLRALNAHLAKPSPKKALVLSFHGWTGSGKNYVARMIGDAMFKKGSDSSYMNTFVSTLHFPHVEEVGTYQRQIRHWISGNLSECERSLFIFDEIDKLPVQLLDAVKPFIDFYERIGNTDPRKSVFLFLSNAGANDIAKRSLSHFEAGEIREQLTMKEFEEIVLNSAYNEGDGGLKRSDLVTKHLVDVFVPFLPLERKHIRMCVVDYMHERGYKVTDERVDKIVNSLAYFPKNNPIYATGGCKPVAQRADYEYGHELDTLELRTLVHDDEL